MTLKKLITSNIIIAAAILATLSCKKEKTDVIPGESAVMSKMASEFEGDMPIAWLNLHFDLIKSTPGYAPPVAARSLAYASIALYESTVNGMPGYRSLGQQLNGLKALPKIDTTKEYNWGIVASTSQYSLLKELFLTTSDKNQTKIDSVRKFFETKFKVGTSDLIIERSIRLGADIATAVHEYSKTDGGATGSISNFPANYVVPVGIGYWKPTSNQKIPLLPNWGANRPLVSANILDLLKIPVSFSFEKSTTFFGSAKEVYDISKTLSSDQKSIANYFADGAGTITPPGHHFNVAKIILKNENAKLNKVAEVFAKVGISLNEAFVCAWRGKYQYNIMRPSTYITQTLDKNWTPYLADPPFPEYASGHSTAAGATVEILESIYGKSLAFEDITYEGIMPTRKYTKIDDYGLETSNSRVYGGIHYRFSCDNGYANGKDIAKNTLKLKFK